MEVVLVATDGSRDAQRAARRAVELAAERGAALHVVCVVDRRRFDEPALSTTELATIYTEDHASSCVSEVRELAATKGVPVESKIRHGVPHEVILTYAEEVDADTIVIGEHGDHDTHLSGVGRQVANLSDREVIVERDADRAGLPEYPRRPRPAG